MPKDGPELEDLDWVVVRHECSPLQAFERLRTEIRDDVETKNKLARAAGSNAFVYAMRVESERAFTVALESHSIEREIRFTFESDLSITARGTNPPVDLSARVTLGDSGKCRLRVKDQTLRFWQFRRRALEDLFFGF